MSWEIVAGIITLSGFAASLIKLVVPLTNSIVKLTDKVELLCEKYDKLDDKRKEEHGRLWAHNEKQDKQLEDHAKRLYDLDGKW